MEDVPCHALGDHRAGSGLSTCRSSPGNGFGRPRSASRDRCIRRGDEAPPVRRMQGVARASPTASSMIFNVVDDPVPDAGAPPASRTASHRPRDSSCDLVHGLRPSRRVLRHAGEAQSGCSPGNRSRAARSGHQPASSRRWRGLVRLGGMTEHGRASRPNVLAVAPPLANSELQPPAGVPDQTVSSVDDPGTHTAIASSVAPARRPPRQMDQATSAHHSASSAARKTPDQGPGKIVAAGQCP